jgi:CheY-like chemotaxis protein
MVRINKTSDDSNNNNNSKNNLTNPAAVVFNDGIIHDNKMVAIDTMKLDAHSRLTLTKNVKDVFPIEPGDKIAVYQNISKKNKGANELIFKIQREGNTIVDTWTVKRNISVSGIQVPNNTTLMKINQNESDNDDDNQQQKNNSLKINNNKIMLVDDEADLLLAFKTILSSQGYNVETFSNSQEALRRFLEVNNNKNYDSQCQTDTLPYYDLVILDIRMPGLNGTQLYQILKALSTNTKILFVSALDAAQEIVSILPSVKSTDIIQKPVEVNHFLKKISETITAPSLSLFFTLVSLIQVITSNGCLECFNT